MIEITPADLIRLRALGVHAYTSEPMCRRRW